MTKKTKIELIFFTVALLFFLAAWTGYTYYQGQKISAVNSFAACVRAGYPVLESYPEQCRTPDGHGFTRELTADEKRNLVPPPPPPPPVSTTPLCENECGNGKCQEIVCLAEGCPCAETAGTCPTDCDRAQIANPASVNCLEKGGKLEMREGPEGTIGYCLLSDGSECEEWAFFRGECGSALFLE